MPDKCGILISNNTTACGFALIVSIADTASGNESSNLKKDSLAIYPSKPFRAMGSSSTIMQSTVIVFVIVR
jgi:hypothetical protein